MSAETAPAGRIDYVTNVSDFIWGGTWEGAEVIPVPPMVIMLLGIGLYIMIGLRFYPIVKLGSAFAGLFSDVEQYFRQGVSLYAPPD